MRYEILAENFDRERINAVATHPLQSWEWGEARKKMGITIVRIGEFHNQVLTNIFQISFHNIPLVERTIGYVPKSVFPSLNAQEYIKKVALQRKAVCVKFEPNSNKSNRDFGLLVPAKHALFPSWTQVLDLSRSEKEISEKMKQKTRYNINLSQRKGVEVKEMTNRDGFEIYSDLYFKTTARQNYKGHTKEYHQMVFNELKDSISHIFVAWYKGVPIAAYHFFIFNKVGYYTYGGSSLDYKNVMGSNLLMWEVIKYCKKHGCTSFDMWGSLPPGYDSSTPWGGFTRFKEGFGTDFVEFEGSYDIVINKPLYATYNIAQSIRKRTIL